MQSALIGPSMSILRPFVDRARAILSGGRTRDFSVSRSAPESPDLIYYHMAGKKRRAHKTWFRGENTNFHPVRASLTEPNAFEKYVGFGWLPDVPFITRDHYITAFGSCFAAEVTKFLVKEGYSVFGRDLSLNSYIIRSGEGIVNTASLLEQFQWGFSNKVPKSSIWYTKSGQLAEQAPEVQNTTRSIFLSTEVFIITLGLSEVWYDKLTGDVFWQAVPKDIYDPDRHGFKILGAEENRSNLQEIVDAIRQHRPEASIIFTLSPVPLAATFRPVSCITANAVSKASLRVAIDELMRSNADDKHIYYFPSYEIITAFLMDPMEDDLRHPRPPAIKFIMEAFKRYYLVD